MDNMMYLDNRSFLNAKLQSATDKIHELDLRIRGNQYAIAHIMALVDTGEWYKDDGYESGVEWAMTNFGIKKTQAYNLITIGREYTREIRNESGLVCIASNLVHTDEGQMPLVDYSCNQLSRLLSLGHDVVKRLHDEGVITPNMTSLQIQAVVKEQKALLNPPCNAPEQPAQPAENAPEQPAQPAENAPEQPAQPAENAPEQPAENAPEPNKEVYARVDHERNGGWDVASSDELIAELVKRGFDVYRGGTRYIITWPVAGE